MIACIMRDFEIWIHANELLKRVFHAQNTADNHRTFSVNMGLSLKDFGEIPHHAFSNLTVLFGSKRCKFAVTPLGCIAKQTQIAKHFLPLRR